jgi:hypothetical protein
MQPFTEVVAGHPAPPADLQPLIEIEVVDAERDADRCQDGEDAELPDERVPVLLLERIVEAVVPLVHKDIDRDQRKLDHDQRREQRTAGQPVLGTEIRRGDSPYGGERRTGVVHRLPSPGEWPQGPEKTGELESLD